MPITFAEIIAAQVGVKDAIDGAEKAWQLVSPNGAAAILDAVYRPIYETLKRVDQDYRQLFQDLFKKLDPKGRVKLKRGGKGTHLEFALEDWKALHHALETMNDGASALRPLRRQLFRETDAMLDRTRPRLWPWSARNYERQFLTGVAAYLLRLPAYKRWKDENEVVSEIIHRDEFYDISTAMEDFDDSAASIMDGESGNNARVLLLEKGETTLWLLDHWYKVVVARYMSLARIFSK